jgi:hypothetical protein
MRPPSVKPCVPCVSVLKKILNFQDVDIEAKALNRDTGSTEFHRELATVQHVNTNHHEEIHSTDEQNVEVSDTTKPKIVLQLVK